jgi:hypothetical protein
MRMGDGGWARLGWCVLAIAAMSSVAASTGHGARTEVGPDFATSEPANQAASDMAQRLETDLSPMPTYAGLQIVRSGIEVDLVGRPPQSVLAAVAADTSSYLGRPIPVSYRSVTRTERELNAIGDRVTADLSWWDGQGIHLSAWGIDLDSNTMQLSLVTYSKAAAKQLTAHYGDGVSVYPADRVVIAN